MSSHPFYDSLLIWDTVKKVPAKKTNFPILYRAWLINYMTGEFFRVENKQNGKSFWRKKDKAANEAINAGRYYDKKYYHFFLDTVDDPFISPEDIKSDLYKGYTERRVLQK
jgi:hypothetical protein